MEMNKKQHENYFKRNDVLLFIGALMLLIGAGLILVGKRRWVMPCCIVMAIGAVIFIVGTTIRVSEKEILAYLARQLEGFDLSFNTLAVHERRVIRDAQPIVVENYDYEQGDMLRKTKNGIVSSRYMKTAIFTLTDAFIVRSRMVSLVSGEIKNKRIEIPYDSVEEIKVIREEKKLTFNNKEFDLTTDKLLIRYGNGYKFITPLHVDIKSKELEEKLHKIIANHTNL